MDTRVLYVTAVLIAAISGGYYYYSGKGNKLDVASAQSMTYSAKGVHLLQTNEQGHVYVKATVDDLQQDMKNQSSQLNNLNASIYNAGRVDSTFQAKKVYGYDDNEKIVLSQDVKATQFGSQGKMVFNTDELTAYPDSRTLETKNQVIVDAPNGQFISQGLQADLTTGQYEFFNIRGKYAPN